MLLLALSDAGQAIPDVMSLAAAPKSSADSSMPNVCLSIFLLCAGPSDRDDRCGVASARDIKGGDMRMGRLDQVLGLISSCLSSSYIWLEQTY